MRKRYELNFDGFWIDQAKDKLPAESGVYAVYGGVYDEEEESTKLEKLLYVAGAQDVRAALADHPKWDEWREVSRLPLDPDKPGEERGEPTEIFIAFAPVAADNEPERAGRAIAFEQRPDTNDIDDISFFNYEDTLISVLGKRGLLNSEYEVFIESLETNR